MKITVPATSANLGPGFDTLGLALDLRNEVVIKKSKFNSISIKGEGQDNPMLKDNNMFVSIFQSFYENLKKPENFRFEFFSKIPLSRGLGSSSAVIVSAIASAYEMAGVKLSKKRLLNYAQSIEGHPDNITSAVMGGFNISVVEDNEVIFINKKLPQEIKAVIVIPNRTISTQASRKSMPFKYTKEETVYNLSRSSLLSGAFMSNNWDLLKEASKDCMHQSFRMKQMPELFALQKMALDQGALMSTLSGSGSTFLNVVMAEDAKKIESKLKKEFPHFRVLTLDFDNSGVIKH